MIRSPVKKQMLVSVGSSNSATTAMTRANGKSSDVLMMMGKSVENIYDKVRDFFCLKFVTKFDF
jgi:hypothetical protein